MKKTRLLLLAVAVFVTNLAMAQTTPFVQLKLGTSSLKSTNDTSTFEGKFGFGLGFGAELAMSENFYIRPSLVYMNRSFGTKTNDTYSDGSNKKKTATSSLHNLEIPVNFIYKFGDASKNTRFYLGGGPNLGFRLSGKEKGTVIETDVNGGVNNKDIDNALNFGSAADDYKRMFFSLGALAGVEFGNTFGIGVEWIGDLTNVYNVDYQVVSPRHVGLRLEFKFGNASGDY